MNAKKNRGILLKDVEPGDIPMWMDGLADLGLVHDQPPEPNQGAYFKYASKDQLTAFRKYLPNRPGGLWTPDGYRDVYLFHADTVVALLTRLLRVTRPSSYYRKWVDANYRLDVAFAATPLHRIACETQFTNQTLPGLVRRYRVSLPATGQLLDRVYVGVLDVTCLRTNPISWEFGYNVDTMKPPFHEGNTICQDLLYRTVACNVTDWPQMELHLTSYFQCRLGYA